MIVQVDGHEAHAATGGVEPNGSDPVIVLIHGAGMDATVWQLQTRYLAYRGFQAIAVDLPGHGRSGGDALESIEAYAAWLGRFLDAAGFEQVALVGHSMGALIGMEAAADLGDRVTSLILLGAAASMPVHPQLLHDAEHDLPAASALMTAWSHGRPAHVGVNPTPGMWMVGGGRALVDVSRPGALATDFAACAAFDGVEDLAPKITAAITVVIGEADKMTPAKAGRSLAQTLGAQNVLQLPATGHSMMVEEPRLVREAIVNALR